MRRKQIGVILRNKALCTDACRIASGRVLFVVRHGRRLQVRSANHLPRMKEALAFIGAIALAVSLWFARGYSDQKIMDTQGDTIRSHQDLVRAKDDLIAKSNALADSNASEKKLLQAALQEKDDIIAKDQTSLTAKEVTIKLLEDSVRSKDEIITKDEAIIASNEGKPTKLPTRSVHAEFPRRRLR